MILKNLSVDCVIFGFDGKSLKVLLSKKNREIVQNKIINSDDYEEIRVLYDDHPSLINDDYWNVLGAHVPTDTDLDEFAQQLLTEATGLNQVYLKQFYSFGATRRVPNYRVITVGYYALINPTHHHLQKSEDNLELQWFTMNDLPKLSFDHKDIVMKALEHLRQKIRFQAIGFHLLPPEFTLTQFQILYETILGKKMDTRNFRKKINKMGLLIDTGRKQQNVSHRAAKLFTFDENIYQKLKQDGLKFRIE